MDFLWRNDNEFWVIKHEIECVRYLDMIWIQKEDKMIFCSQDKYKFIKLFEKSSEKKESYRNFLHNLTLQLWVIDSFEVKSLHKQKTIKRFQKHAWNIFTLDLIRLFTVWRRFEFLTFIKHIIFHKNSNLLEIVRWWFFIFYVLSNVNSFLWQIFWYHDSIKNLWFEKVVNALNFNLEKCIEKSSNGTIWNYNRNNFQQFPGLIECITMFLLKTWANFTIKLVFHLNETSMSLKTEYCSFINMKMIALKTEFQSCWNSLVSNQTETFSSPNIIFKILFKLVKWNFSAIIIDYVGTK